MKTVALASLMLLLLKYQLVQFTFNGSFGPADLVVGQFRLMLLDFLQRFAAPGWQGLKKRFGGIANC